MSEGAVLLTPDKVVEVFQTIGAIGLPDRGHESRSDDYMDLTNRSIFAGIATLHFGYRLRMTSRWNRVLQLEVFNDHSCDITRSTAPTIPHFMEYAEAISRAVSVIRMLDLLPFCMESR